MTVHAFDSFARTAAAFATELDSRADRLLTPYRAIAGVRRSKGVPMNGFNDAERISSFLSSVARGPAALLIDGEVGIGRTTAWLAAAEEARAAGFRVLSARAGLEETGFALGTAAELIRDVDAEVLSFLPELQRRAVERNLLHVDGDHSNGDQRAVVAAFTAIVNKLSETSPVLIAIDDVQWLDAASRDLLAFAARRLRGPVGLLLTERNTSGGAAAWLKLDHPDSLHRLRIRPMEPSQLQRLISDRIGRAIFPPDDDADRRGIGWKSLLRIGTRARDEPSRRRRRRVCRPRSPRSCGNGSIPSTTRSSAHCSPRPASPTRRST